MKATPFGSTPIDMKSPRFRSAAPVPAVQPRPDTHMGLRWIACGVARTSEYEGEVLVALRLCANAMYQGPVFDVTAAGLAVVYHARAARPDDPATTEVKTLRVPAALTVVAADQVLPWSVDTATLTL